MGKERKGLKERGKATKSILVLPRVGQRSSTYTLHPIRCIRCLDYPPQQSVMADNNHLFALQLPQVLPHPLCPRDVLLLGRLEQPLVLVPLWSGDDVGPVEEGFGKAFLSFRKRAAGVARIGAALYKHHQKVSTELVRRDERDKSHPAAQEELRAGRACLTPLAARSRSPTGSSEWCVSGER